MGKSKGSFDLSCGQSWLDRGVRLLGPVPIPHPARAAQAALTPGFWSLSCHPLAE